MTAEKVHWAGIEGDRILADKKKKGREWRILGWIALATLGFLFVAIIYRESIKKHAPRPLQTPLAPKEPAAE